MCAAKSQKESMTFEAASARLEELIAAMERGDLPLDQMIEAFEEGRKLVAFCNEKLTEVQQRVEKINLTKKDDETSKSEELFTLEPF